MIRHGEEKDLEDILEIYNDAILNTTAVYTYKVQTLEQRKEWFNNKVSEGYPVFVFEENNIVVGFSTFGPFRPWEAYKYTIEHSVYVNKESRGKGIGALLLKKIIEEVNERGYATLVAGIDSKNTVSIKIHENLGFKYCGTIKKAGYKFESWLHLVFYQLDLVGPKKPVEN
ncbi:MAG: GNAT family N-acetyltransferase [Clostridium sp.]